MKKLEDVRPEVLPFGSSTGFTIADAAPEGAMRSYETPFEATPHLRSSGVTLWKGGEQVLVAEPGLPHVFGPITSKLGPFLDNQCKYCSAPLVLYNEGGMPSNQQWRRADAVECPACRWWLFVWTKVQYPDDALHRRIREAAVCSFDYKQGEAPLMQLRRRIADGKVDLRSITPTTLERIVAAVFRDFLGAGVTHVGGPGDGGVDVLIFDGDPPMVIQVKRRTTASAEGASIVRDLVGALAYRGWRRGAIVTTATHFSSDAEQTMGSSALQRDGYVVDLYAIDALRDIVASAEPRERPWREFLPPGYGTS